MKRLSGLLAVGGALGRLRTLIRAGLLVLAWLGLFALPAGEARATAYTWLGLGGSNAWEDTLGNWNTQYYPGLVSSSDTVLFPSFNTQRYNVEINNQTVVTSITFQRPGYSILRAGRIVVINGIFATTENAANWGINQSMAFGGDMAVNNLTGTGFISPYNTSPSVLHVVGGAGNFSGNIQDGVALDVGDGTQIASLTLNQLPSFPNLYSGGTTVNTNATLIAGTPGALCSTSAHTINGTLSLVGGANTVGGLAGAGHVTLGSNILTINGGGSFSGDIIGSGGLVKSGSGTLALSAANGYSGVTTISGGKLAVNGSITGDAIAENGGTLGGSGTVSGAVTVESGGTLAPGNSPGHFTLMDDLTLDLGASLEIEFGGTAASLYDQLDVQGFFTAGGTLDLLLISGFTPVAGNTFTIFNGLTPGFDSGSFNIYTNLSGGLIWDTSMLASNGVLTVIPEPSALVLVFIVGFGLLIMRHRKPAISISPSALLVAASVFLRGEARATEFTWFGEGNSNRWEDTTGNWEGGLNYPGYINLNDTAVFPPLPQRYQTLVDTTTTVAGITYNWPGYSLTAIASLIVTGGISATYDNAPNLIADGGVYLGGTSTVKNLTGSGTLNPYSSSPVLNVVGPSGNFGGGIRSNIAITLGDGVHISSLTLSHSNDHPNNYIGATLVQANATLVTGTADALGAASAHTINGTLSLAGGAGTVSSLSGSGTVNLGSNALTINGGGTTTFSGAITGAGGSLVKSGAGKLTLSAINSYTGSSTLSGGELAVDGSIAGDVNVQNGGTLGGSGTVGGAVAVQAGGTLSPGNSPGHFTLMDDLTLDVGTSLEIEFGGTAASLYDQLDVQGFFTAGGTLDLLLISGFTPVAGNTFTIFNGLTPGFDGGSFNIITTNLTGGLVWDTSNLASVGIVTVIPEPSPWVLLFATGVAFVALRRR